MPIKPPTNKGFDGRLWSSGKSVSTRDLGIVCSIPDAAKVTDVTPLSKVITLLK
jgi:hypothetical protein